MVEIDLEYVKERLDSDKVLLKLDKGILKRDKEYLERNKRDLKPREDELDRQETLRVRSMIENLRQQDEQDKKTHE